MTQPALLWLHTIGGVQVIALRDMDALTIEDRLQDVETLTFSVPGDSDRAPYLIPDTLVRMDARYWRITEVKQSRDAQGESLIEVTAEARWTDLSAKVRAGTTSILGKTITQGLTSILAGTGWTVGSVPAGATLYSLEDIDATVTALLRRWATITGNEVRFDTSARTVSFTAAVGSNNGIGFRYAHNLVTMERRYAPPAVTRLYAFGANNLEITGVNPTALPYIENYSWYTAQGLTLAQAQAQYRKDQIWVDERYLLALNLYDAAVLRLAALSQPRISYECSVLDLYALTGAAISPVAIGDTVRVFDSEFGLDLGTRVVRILHHPNAPWTDEIELSFLQRTLSDADLAVSTRSPDYGALAILVAQNIAGTVAGTNVLWASITYTVAGVTNIVMGATFKGTATGTGTVRFDIVDNVTQVGASYDFAFTAGQVEFSWPQFATGLAEGSHVISWRARVVSGTGTIAIADAECRAWLLSYGAVGVGISTSPNQDIQETLALVYLTVTDSVLVEMITPVDLTPSQNVPYVLLCPTHSGAISASATSGITIYSIPSGGCASASG